MREFDFSRQKMSQRNGAKIQKTTESVIKRIDDIRRNDIIENQK